MQQVKEGSDSSDSSSMSSNEKSDDDSDWSSNNRKSESRVFNVLTHSVLFLQPRFSFEYDYVIYTSSFDLNLNVCTCVDTLSTTGKRKRSKQQTEEENEAKRQCRDAARVWKRRQRIIEWRRVRARNNVWTGKLYCQASTHAELIKLGSVLGARKPDARPLRREDGQHASSDLPDVVSFSAEVKLGSVELTSRTRALRRLWRKERIVRNLLCSQLLHKGREARAIFHYPKIVSRSESQY